MATAPLTPKRTWTCPQCQSDHVAGTLKCPCGHQFRLVQEQPLWALDFSDPTERPGLFSFQRFVTPAVVKAGYVVGVLGISAASVVVALMPGDRILLDLPLHPKGQAVLVGCLTFVLGNLIWRILCELLILPFNLYTSLTELQRRLKRRG